MARFRDTSRPCRNSPPSTPRSTTASTRTVNSTAATLIPSARHAKAAGQPHACAPPSTAGQTPAGRPVKPGLGENGDEPCSPSFATGPSTATFFSILSVMVRSSLDTSIKPILCPRKSGPTHLFLFSLTREIEPYLFLFSLTREIEPYPTCRKLDSSMVVFNMRSAPTTMSLDNQGNSARSARGH